MAAYKEELTIDDFLMYGFHEYQNAVMFFYKSPKGKIYIQRIAVTIN